MKTKTAKHIRRCPPYIINEDIFLQEIYNKLQNSFSEGSFIPDRLATLQHYGMPTRLLDITADPLVALFFCVSDDGHDEEEGAVYIYTAGTKDNNNLNLNAEGKFYIDLLQHNSENVGTYTFESMNSQ